MKQFLWLLVLAIIVVPSVGNRYLKILSHEVSGPYLHVSYMVKKPVQAVRLWVTGNGRTTFCDIVPKSTRWGAVEETTCVVNMSKVTLGL